MLWLQKNVKTEEAKTAGNSVTDKTNNPTTGDTIYVAIAIFAIAGIGLFVTIHINKKNKVRKH